MENIKLYFQYSVSIESSRLPLAVMRLRDALWRREMLLEHYGATSTGAVSTDPLSSQEKG